MGGEAGLCAGASLQAPAQGCTLPHQLQRGLQELLYFKAGEHSMCQGDV